MQNPRTELTIRQTEIPQDLPIGLQYFLAIDAIFGNVKAEKLRGSNVFQIHVYGNGEHVPTINILRFTNVFDEPEGRLIENQDEIGLSTKDTRQQLNGAIQNGQYIRYPKELTLTSLTFLQDTIEAFIRLGQRDGSTILINGQKEMISKNGVWEEVVKNKTRGGTPTLPNGGHGLSSGVNPELPEPPQAIDFGLILNQLLKLKKRIPT